MTEEFSAKVSAVCSDPYTWDLGMNWDDDPQSPDRIALRNAQSEFMRNASIEKIHHMHLILDPQAIMGSIMGMFVDWTLVEFTNEVANRTLIGQYQTFDDKRVREITYYSDKDAVEFVYASPHPLDPQPPNTVHKAENHMELVEALRLAIADKWDQTTAEIEAAQQPDLLD